LAVVNARNGQSVCTCRYACVSDYRWLPIRQAKRLAEFPNRIFGPVREINATGRKLKSGVTLFAGHSSPNTTFCLRGAKDQVGSRKPH